MKLFFVILVCVSVLFAPVSRPAQCRIAGGRDIHRRPMRQARCMATMPCCRCGPVGNACMRRMNGNPCTGLPQTGGGSRPCSKCRLTGSGGFPLAFCPSVSIVLNPVMPRLAAAAFCFHHAVIRSAEVRRLPYFRWHTPQSRYIVLII